MRMVGVGLCCATMLFACGCGKSTVNVTTPRRAQTDSASVAAQGSSSVSATKASVPPAQGLLTHPTPRPPGVNAQFDFVGGAGPGACYGAGGAPGVRVLVEPFPGAVEWTAEGFNDKGIATYGQPVDVCFDGMGRGPISVTVNGPRGFAMSGVLPRLPESYGYNNEWSSFDWVPAIEPSWPEGSYVITARAGAVSQRHTLTLIQPHSPGIRVFGPSTDPGHNSVPPDSNAKLFLTGFKGSSKIKLTAYRTTGFAGPARFFSTATVPIPASGNAVVEIPTAPDKDHKRSLPTFIITTRTRGRTLSAPFTVFREKAWADVVVGPLPGS